MSYVNINGVMRKITPMIKLNGVIREAHLYHNTNGFYRKLTEKDVEQQEIDHFKLLYTKNKTITHPDFKHLKYNENLPAAALTSEDADMIDMNPKSIIFTFDNSKYREEGLCCYCGYLYAVLTNGFEILTNTIDNLDIWIRGYNMYQCYANKIYGWNGFFSNHHFLDIEGVIPDERNVNQIDRFYITPINKTISSFSPLCTIGIARDMTDPDKNMIGSRGIMDHTLEKVCVNDIEYPFILKIA